MDEDQSTIPDLPLELKVFVVIILLDSVLFSALQFFVLDSQRSLFNVGLSIILSVFISYKIVKRKRGTYVFLRILYWIAGVALIFSLVLLLLGDDKSSISIYVHNVVYLPVTAYLLFNAKSKYYVIQYFS